MKVLAASITHAGGRQNNQDAVAEAWSVEGRCGCWVVADGLGGHQAGEVASAMAYATILNAYRDNPAAALEQVGAYLQLAQDTLIEAQQTDEALADMRTTAVVLVIDGETARWAHCGDSRLYAFQNTAMVRQTVDDSVPQALVAMGQLSPDAIRFHEDRNRLTRCLGSPDKFRFTVSAPLTIRPGTAFLLCTDGYWEFVHELEMAIDLAKAASPATWLELMSARLISRAPPGHDNYTALALWIDED